MKKKFDFMQFYDHNYDPSAFVLNYNKYKNKEQELADIIATETDFDEYTIREGYARYYPKHEFFDGEGGYMLVDNYTNGCFKVFICEGVENNEN